MSTLASRRVVPEEDVGMPALAGEQVCDGSCVSKTAQGKCHRSAAGMSVFSHLLHDHLSAVGGDAQVP